MDVELAEERLLVLKDRFSMDHAEGRASTRRLEAFGTMAKLTGFLSRPREEDFETVYRERRLQPFWHIGCTSTVIYEREREYKVAVEPAVQSVLLDGTVRDITNGTFAITGNEHRRDEVSREGLFDGVRGTQDAALYVYLKHDSTGTDAAALAAETANGTIVVPPEAKASMLARDVMASAIPRIEADRVLEEKVSLHHVDLYYRPVYAFRYRWQGKEAVVEFDGVTGDVHPGGDTFEQFLGVKMDAEFLINAGVEAAGIFIPGARLAEIVISRSMKANRAAAKR